MEDYNVERVHYGFYETDEQLGVEPLTEEEFQEYKRLIGMPLSEDYEEIMESLIAPPFKSSDGKKKIKTKENL